MAKRLNTMRVTDPTSLRGGLHRFAAPTARTETLYRAACRQADHGSREGRRHAMLGHLNSYPVGDEQRATRLWLLLPVVA